MRVLHDYNYQSLEEIQLDVDEVSKLLSLLNTYVHDKGYDDSAAILLDLLESRAETCDHDFCARLSSIMASKVPPEGAEPVPLLVYPETL